MTTKKVRRPALPRPDQDVCHATEIRDNFSHGRSGWSRVYVFDDTERVRARLTKMMATAGYTETVGWHVDRNLMFWHKDIGVGEAAVDDTLPFVPPRHATGIELPGLRAMRQPDRAWPVILTPSGVDDAPCARCQPDAAMFCKPRGGVRQVLRIILLEKPSLLKDCLFTPAVMAAADQASVARSLPTAPAHITQDLKDFMQLKSRSEFWSKEMLADVGFWVSTRTECFAEDMGFRTEITDDDLDAVDELTELGVMTMSATEIRKVMTEHGVTWTGSDLVRPEKHQDRYPVIGSMVMDAGHVRRAIVAGVMARSQRTIELQETMQVRKAFCGPCAYKCPRPGECTITDYAARSLLARPDDKHTADAQRWWMALFAVSGERVTVGKMKTMVWGPNNETTALSLEKNQVILRNLRPSFRIVDRIEIGDVDALKLDPVHEAYECIGRLSWPEQARLYFALRQIWRYCHPHRRPRFYKGKSGDKNHRGQSQENDVLSIQLSFLCPGKPPVITVGSDTCAHSYGGRNPLIEVGALGKRMKPQRIMVDERPRFTTEYHHPYYEDILAWTGEPLGSKKSHHGLTVVDGERTEDHEEERKEKEDHRTEVPGEGLQEGQARQDQVLSRP